jgi:hypothetical protein
LIGRDRGRQIELARVAPVGPSSRAGVRPGRAMVPHERPA